MATWTGLRRQRAGQGFTLLELLLTTLSLLLLFGAVVLSFDSLQRGAELEEAALQIEGLLHFARAQAAQTGRRVQLNFEEKIDDDFFLALGGLRLLWEPDPLEQPGVFKPLPEAEDYVRGITDAVMIETVRRLDVNGRELSTPTAEFSEEQALASDGYLEETPPINFYPDGSSDSAVIVVTSWDENDPRRLELKLLGLTGTTRRVLRSVDAETSQLEPAEQSAQTNTPGKTGPAKSAPAL